MSNVLDSLPPEVQDVLTAVLDERDSALLNPLRASSEPGQDEREAVEDVLSDAFSEQIGDDGEPTERGRLIDDAGKVPAPLAHRRLTGGARTVSTVRVPS